MIETKSLDQLSVIAGKRVKEREYWLSRLSGSFDSHGFPYDFSVGHGNEVSEPEAVEFDVPADLVAGLEKLSSGSDVRLHMVLTAGVTALMYRYAAGALDNGTPFGDAMGIRLGSPILKPKEPGTKDFINTFLVLFQEISAETTFKKLLLSTRETLAGALEHRNYPVEILARDLGIPFNAGEPFPLCDIAVLVDSIHDFRLIQHLNLPMVLSLHKNGSSLRGKWQFNPGLFKRSGVERLAAQLMRFLQRAVNRPDSGIDDIDILSEEEKEKILTSSHETGGPYTNDDTLHRLLEKQARLTPDAPAVVLPADGETGDIVSCLSYAELDRRASVLAGILMEKGLEPGQIAALLVNRSLHMVIGIFALLKSGSAYVPISPKAPGERIGYMLTDSNARFLLTDNPGAYENSTAFDVLDIGTFDYSVETRKDIVWPDVDSQDLAYIIYTSGSTGAPKGVAVNHANVSPLIHWAKAFTGIDANDRVIQNSSYIFDFSIYDFFVTLSSGAALYIASEEIVSDPQRLLGYLESNKITILNLTPSQCRYLVDVSESSGITLSHLRLLCFGGERLPVELAERSLHMTGGACRVYNVYGPTETTVIVTTREVGLDDVAGFKAEDIGTVPIGKPIANAFFMVLDRLGNLCPIGVEGELYIGGDSVSRGYLNDVTKTRDSYLSANGTGHRWGTMPRALTANSLESYEQEQNLSDARAGTKHRAPTSDERRVSSHEPRASNRFYKSGDRVKWLENGELEFTGRVDFQVKVRGFRIETGEIENRLLEHQSVGKTVVLAREYDNGENYLCCYIVAASGCDGKNIEINELREFLLERLPDYMLPAYFVMMAEFPLTGGGKVDLKRLPEPVTDETGEGFIAPRDDIEKDMAGLWADVLGVEPGTIGIDDDFFQLGGHSLKATTLIYRAYKTFEVNLQVDDIFVCPTVRELANIVKEKVEKGDRHRFARIEPVEEKEYYLVSSAQKRLFLLQRMDPGSIGYNLPVALTIDGRVEQEKLERVFRQLIARHESLRTSFFMIDGQPVQQISAGHADFRVEHIVLDKGQNLENLLKQTVRPFDISCAPLLRVLLIDRDETESRVMMVDMHHIISDGMSMAVLVDDFMEMFRDETGTNLTDLPVRYRDFSNWQDLMFQSGVMAKQENYWLNIFSGDIPVLELPLDYARPAEQVFDGAASIFNLPGDRLQRLQALARQEDATLFMIVLTAYYILLSRLSGQDDIVIGFPVAGRSHADLDKVIGMFVNTLALRIRSEGTVTIRQLIGAVRENVLEAFAHQDYPFELLVEKVAVQRELNRNPLFDAFLAWENIDIQELKLPGLMIGPLDTEAPAAKFDLSLRAAETGDGLHCNLNYCSALFDGQTIRCWSNYFARIAAAIAGDADSPVHTIDLLGEEEKELLLSKFNRSEDLFPDSDTLHGIFERQAEKTPDSPALAIPVSQLQPGMFSYEELDLQAMFLAEHLESRGIGPGDIVALIIENSLEMVFAILGVLKTGAAYLPISPKSPAERVRYMLADSCARVLLTTRSLYPGDTIPGNPGIPAVFINRLYGSISGRRRTHDPVDGSGLAYIIYTSGSTGTPKGVAVEHRNVTPLLHWARSNMGVAAGDKVIVNTSYFFDVSVLEIFNTLWNGAALYIASRETLTVPGLLSAYIVENRITAIHLTPSQCRYLLDDYAETGLRLESLKHFFLAAERLPIRLAERVFQMVGDSCRVFNQYGPTEASILSSSIEIPRRHIDSYKTRGLSSIPIGGVLANTTLYVLDRFGNLCPPGTPGELYIGGHGVAPGYLNDIEKTAASFISPNSFDIRRGTMPRALTLNSHESYDRERNLSNANAGKKHRAPTELPTILYKTGDWVRWLDDGNLEFISRIDHQVKIRGFRIETGEIENRLLGHSLVGKTVVKAWEYENGETYLCAYVVPVPGEIPEEGFDTELREYLSERLQDYMIPAYFVAMEEFPLTPSGKINLRALPAPDHRAAGTSITAPQDESQKKLAQLWAEVLNIPLESIGIDTNFFSAGGHSLKAAVLVSAIHKTFHAKLSLGELFKRPTIKTQAEYLAVARKDVHCPVEPAEQREYYPLSPAQKRMFVLQEMEAGSTAYNMPIVVPVGDTPKEHLEKIFQQLIARHDSLRTAFISLMGVPVQRVLEPAAEFRLPDIPAERWQDAVRPFDLSQAPLLRAGMITEADGSRFLFLDMHHIITDGVSNTILVKDIAALLKKRELPPLKLQYKDYACQYENEKLGGAYTHRENFWLDRFNMEEVPVLELPYDFSRPVVQSYEGDRELFQLDGPQVDDLKMLAAERGATLYMVLLAVYSVLLNKLGGSEGFIVGTPVAGRSHADLQGIIGLFVNTLALPVNVQPDREFPELLDYIKDMTVGAFENQDYPFEELVEKVGVQRETSRNPLFDVMFSLAVDSGEQVDLFGGSGIEIPDKYIRRKTSKVDLTFGALEQESGIIIDVEYSTRLFKTPTIRRFIDYFKRIVSQVTRRPRLRISEIETIGEEDRKKILDRFNDTAFQYPGEKTLHGMFEDRASRSPDSVFSTDLTGPDIRLVTYSEMNRRADRLAAVLRRNGAGTGTIAAIMIDRSLEMLTAVFAIMKAGAAYLAVSARFPEERIRFTLTDSSSSFVFTSSHGENPGSNWSRLEVEENCRLWINTESESGKIGTASSYDPAYVIYTSGTTGRPKGVLVEHIAVVNRFCWINRQYGLIGDDVIMQKTSVTFDVSVCELFRCIPGGGRVLLMTADGEKDPALMIDAIERYRVTSMDFVPVVLRVFLDAVQSLSRPPGFSSLRRVFIGVEAIDVSMAEQFNRLIGEPFDVSLFNCYGPTEACVDITHYRCPHGTELENRVIPIGSPIGNVNVLILDSSLNLQPIGVVGEIFIGGHALARGYLNRPELTAKKFIKKDFLTKRFAGGPGESIFNSAPLVEKGNPFFRTGDLGRWQEDGNIEFIGRADSQVKIRGYRVELEGIQTLLKKHPEVKDAVVIARKQEGSGENYLCAYIVKRNEMVDGMDIQALKEFLLHDLPGYMVPAYFNFLAEIPLTINGKVDRKKLPEPVFTASQYVAPGTRDEKLLAGIFAGVLEVERIGIDDHFFEMGGHSLKAVMLISRVRREMNVKLVLADVFQRPTVRELAIRIGEYEKETAGPDGIEPVEKKEYYPLSPAQKRLFILNRLEDGEGLGYNLPEMKIMEGKLEREKLARAFEKLIKRHESLRTSFGMVKEEPVQFIHCHVDFQVRYYDRGTPETNFLKPFDLSKAPLLRVGVVEKSENEYLLMVDMHHIITDGTSHQILTREFLEFYPGGDLEPLPVQYKDYSHWLNTPGQALAMKKQEAFWLDRFAEELPVLNLPLDFPRPAVQEFKGDSYRFHFTPEETEILSAVATGENVSMFILLLAVSNVMLSVLSGGGEDIVVGTPVAARRHTDLEAMVGMFVNTLALRNFPKSRQTFNEFLAEVRDNTLSAFENQEYPFEELVDNVSVRRDTGRNPVFDVMFALHSREMAAPSGKKSPGENAGLHVKPYKFESGRSLFDLSFHIMEGVDRLHVIIEYCTALFKRTSIERFAGYFKRIGTEICNNPGIRLKDIDMMGESEKTCILEMAAGIVEPLEHPDTIHGLIEKQAESNPGNIALVDETGAGVTLTYGQFNKKANALARILRHKGTVSGSVAAVMMDRSYEMIVSILAILKTGAAFLPIDPKLPEQRKRFMLADSHVGLVLVNSKDNADDGNTNDINYFPDFVEAVDVPSLDLDAQDESNPGYEDASDWSQPLYVIYTSGSTGRPKGIVLKHSNFVNLMFYQQNHTSIDFSKILQFATISFDVSPQEIFTALTGGGALYLIPADLRTRIPDFFRLIRSHEICTLFLPVQFVRTVFAEEEYAALVPPCVRHIIAAGEQLVVSDRLRDFLKQNRVYLHNHYGPAETHAVTTLELKPGTDIPELPSIGYPISNTEIFILDKNHKLTPSGVAGELCIAGAQVGKGYLNNPELTAEKFISLCDTNVRRGTMPRALPADSGETDEMKRNRCLSHEGTEHRVPTQYAVPVTIYKSGDLARYNADGSIEFLGRIDHQVKIRGFRIEPGEVENRLMDHELVREAVVIVKEGIGGDKFLAAYIVMEPGVEAYDLADLGHWLSRDLPDYMVPSSFTRLEKIPLNPSGKVDRRALPEPAAMLDGLGVEARTETEKKLEDLWKTVLFDETSDAPIYIDRNFFELGGHSLRATVLTSKIHKVFNVKIPLIDIFKYSTIRELARLIDQKSGEAREMFRQLEPSERREYYPLSSAQLRLYILQQLDPGSNAYNMPFVLKVSGEADTARLEQVFKALVSRHEILRTSFIKINRKPYQKVHEAEEIGFHIHIIDEPSNETDYRELETIIDDFNRPFDLSSAPLLRVGIVRRETGSLLLIVNMHHIVSDGHSVQILTREFMELYHDRQLPSLRIQYKDFAGVMGSDRTEQLRGFWLDRLKGEIPVLNLPGDFARPAIKDYAGDRFEFILNENLTGKLQALALREETTLYMVLLTAFYSWLSRLSGSSDIIVGSPVAGRNHDDLEPLIGMFVNTLALRAFPEHEKTVEQLLAEVKNMTLGAFENQNYPFEDMVEQLGESVNRDPGRNPVFDVMFVLQNTGTGSAVQETSLSMEPVEFKSPVSKFDLMLASAEVENRLLMVFEYRTSLFTAGTIRRFSRYFETMAAAIVDDPGQRLAELEIIPADEKSRILESFNCTTANFPGDKTIHALFEEQVERGPDRIAGVYEDRWITYGELNSRANMLARVLKDRGAGPDSITAVMSNRCIEMLIMSLGILKAGAGFLPLDSGMPVRRIGYMLADSCSPVLVTTKAMAGDAAESANIPVVFLEDTQQGDPSNPVHVNTASDLMYVVYTSGTTGRPKGTLVAHRSLVNFCTWHCRFYGITDEDRALQYSSFSFDGSVWDIYPHLISGAQCHIVHDDIKLDIIQLKRYFNKNRITIVFLTTQFGQQFNADETEVKSLRHLLIGGEKLQRAVLRNYRLVNNYGPTETTVVTSAYPIDKIEHDYPIGKPVFNNTFLILDPVTGNIQPIGVPGELCVGGEGVCRGYLNQPELTAQKFFYPGERPEWKTRSNATVEILKSFGNRSARRGTMPRTLTADSQKSYEPERNRSNGQAGTENRAPTSGEFRAQSLFYRTGDLVKWRADGNVEFVGRIDHQVKIRGFRIELGEIESVLVSHENVKEAAVIQQVSGGGRDTFICAYVAGTGGLIDDSGLGELKAYLGKELPSFMVPSVIIPLERIPLNINGKVDRKALPKPSETRALVSASYVAPASEMEKRVADAWKEILGIEKVGLDDNFFELGGNSLSIIELSGKLKDVLGEEIPMVKLFQFPKINSLLEHLEKKTPGHQQATAEHTQREKPKRKEAVKKGKDMMKRSMQRRRSR